MSDEYVTWADMTGFIDWYRTDASVSLLYPATSAAHAFGKDDFMQHVSKQTGFRVDTIQKNLDKWREQRG